MAFKVLENNGTLTTASEGITINKVNQHNKNGIIRGRLNDLEITNSTNTLTIATGHIIINGINLILEDSTSFTIAPVSSLTQKYLIVEIVATSEGITAELQVVNQYSAGRLDFTSNTITGTYRHLIATLFVGSTGIVSVNKELNFLEENHLYEHNIVLADNSSNITNSSVFATFKILTNSATPMDESDVAILLYDRGNNGIGTCLTASGRYDDDSFSYVNNIRWQDQEDDVGYCDSVVIGVYGNGDEELMLVVMSLDEDDSTKVYEIIASGTYWHDTVVPLI